MTEPRTLQERLRELTCDGYDGPYWTAQKHQAMHEAADALAEAREALEPFAKDADAIDVWLKSKIGPENPDCEATSDDFRRARAVLAKLKAASGE